MKGENAMPEINNKLSFKDINLSRLFKQFESELTEYVNQAQDLAAKDKRKQEVVSELNALIGKIYGCPPGTVWDQQSRKCIKIS